MHGNKGKKLNEEHKRKIGLAHKGKIVSIETRKKLSESHKGYKMPELQKLNMSKAKKGIDPVNRKNLYTSELNKKRAEKMRGDKNYNWKGGFTHTQKMEMKAGRQKSDNCEICGAIGMICYDHDHETEKFRGWICKRCNSVLGFVKDNTETLEAMVRYLIKNK